MTRLREGGTYYDGTPYDADSFDLKGEDDFYRLLPEDDTFHVGQSYEDTAAVTIACATCGGRDFNVGVGDYATVIRCVTCKWEYQIHSG